tara:strand:- start:2543 stop:3043 length:501 start_codon:yes stop_codon:yes gene_type:complete
MLIDRLCSPALIYLAFSMIQLILDLSDSKFRLSVAKLIITLIFTYLLNILCDQKLSIISWILVSLPFLFMGYFSILLVYALGFSDKNGNDMVMPNQTEDQEVLTEDPVTEAEPIAEESTNEQFMGFAMEPYTTRTKSASKSKDEVVTKSKAERLLERYNEDVNNKE